MFIDFGDYGDNSTFRCRCQYDLEVLIGRRDLSLIAIKYTFAPLQRRRRSKVRPEFSFLFELEENLGVTKEYGRELKRG